MIGCWLFLSLSQTLHFYFYFEQTLWNSIRWSFRDWLVWFGIFAMIYSLCKGRALFTRFSPKNFLIVAAIALGSGIVQTLIITSLDFIAGTATRPFWQDFAHFYSKRWLQYFFIFVIFWLSMLNYFWVNKSKNQSVSPASDAQPQDKIKIADGKKIYWFQAQEIYTVESAGNYLCYYTNQGQIIARGSLKLALEQLEKRGFLRVSRSHIVNQEAIKTSQRLTKNRVELVLNDGNTVPIGTTYWQKVKKQLLL